MKRKTHCKQGHEFTDENTYWRKDKLGWRACRVCNKLNARKVYRSNPEKYSERGRLSGIKRRRKVKQEVLSYYSKYNAPKCNYCGFNNIDALCLDHINNDGVKERRHKTRTSYRLGCDLYFSVRRRGYPKGYQTLCANCNLIKKLERDRRGI